jgi:L-asparagine transporter-like permease
MLEWIVVGAVVVVILVVKLLDELEVFDVVDFFGAILKLVTGTIALLGAFFIWSARKISGAQPKSAPRDRGPAPRGKRAMARSTHPSRPNA